MTLVPHAVEPDRLPNEMIRVNAARVSAQVASFVVFARRQFSIEKQNNARVTQSVIVRILSLGLVRVKKCAIRSLSFGLNQRNFATCVRQKYKWSVVQPLHPFLQQFSVWFVPTHALMQEKFLTIRRVLCGISSLGSTINDDFVNVLKAMFAALQIPFESIVRQEGVRYSFLNYNFLFRRFFDLCNRSHYGKDFAPLKSKKKREETILLYLRLLEVVKWPYINTDGTLFGTEYHTDITALRRKR